MTITDADVATVRRFYAAFIPRDFETMRACFTPDAVWHLPGRNAIAGDHVGLGRDPPRLPRQDRPAVGRHVARRSRRRGVGTDHLVAIQHATAEHDGRKLDVTGCQLIRMEDGLIAEVTGHYSDQYAFDAFWRAEA